MNRKLPLALLLFCLAYFASGRELAAAGFDGEWETTYGRMSLKVKGDKVQGNYQFPGGAENSIDGTVKGTEFQFAYTEASAKGAGTFTLSDDGQSFTGSWREAGVKEWNPWSGRRPAVESGDFSGVWKTSFGMMRLIQKDSGVTGCYTYGEQSLLSGTVKGNVLTYNYTEPSGVKGGGEFRLSSDASAFEGAWKTADAKQGGAWTGSRVEPTPGRTWLVVLEAHWESSLQQNEYSYGDMLRQFFTRVPSVAVRHRFFDDKADFAQWCGELPYLTEPVILYVSSHGSEEGITVGKKVLSGKFLGEQIRFAPCVKLVHLGACLTMAGAAPDDLRTAAGRKVPVSGFTKVADWAGSAVIDFSYLDLILSRGMPAGEAVRQIQNNLTFAGEKEDPDCVIKPAGLRIVE